MQKIDLSQVPEHQRRIREYDDFRVLQNGRIRYYGKYKPSKSPGITRGCRNVTEVEASTGNVIRSWYECYDSKGKVIVVHPKKPLDLGHFRLDPLTGKEIERW